MLKSRLHLPLLLVSGIVSATLACSSGGEDAGPTVTVPMAGNTSTAGGSDSGGSGNPTPTGGSSTTAGTTSGDAGSQAMAGSGGSGTGGGMGGMGGSGGAAGGMGGSGGGDNSFCGTEVGKVVLYDGSDATFKNWYPTQGGMNSPNPWKNNTTEKTMTEQGSDIISKTGFQNVCLHVEYRAPTFTYPAGTGDQNRGNSGIYLKASWELQVLDSFDLGKNGNDLCGAIYKVAAPLVIACKDTGEWNVYDAEFQANVCTNGTTTTPAKFVKVNLNGINIHNDVPVPLTQTEAGQTPTCEPRGVLLQNHGTAVPVEYRNIWAIPRP